VELDELGRLPCLTDRSHLSRLYLRRLKRVLLLRFYTESLLSPTDRRLLDRVIYSTFCDCREVNASGEARKLLQEARSGSGRTKPPLAQIGGNREWTV
jgi:hypothetical protein